MFIQIVVGFLLFIIFLIFLLIIFKPSPAPPAACIPSCSNKNCGDDGCGGSCGKCDTSCINGTCQIIVDNTIPAPTMIGAPYYLCPGYSSKYIMMWTDASNEKNYNLRIEYDGNVTYDGAINFSRNGTTQSGSLYNNVDELPLDTRHANVADLYLSSVNNGIPSLEAHSILNYDDPGCK